MAVKTSLTLIYRHHRVIVLFHLLTGCLATSGVTESKWSALTLQNVTLTSAQLTLKARTAVECIKECGKYSHCNLVAVDKEMGKCYLLPTFGGGGGADPHTLVAYKAPKCNTDDAPQVTGGTVTWHRTLTSLYGDVMCPANFLLTSDDGTLRCDADTNTWNSGQCAQYFWQNPNATQKYFIPMAVETGWKMCVNGTPSAQTSWNMNFYSANNNRPMRVLFDLSQNRTTFQNVTTGVGFITNHIIQPTYIMTKDQPFVVVVEAKTASSFSVVVNGVLHHTYETYNDVSAVVSFMYAGSATIWGLNLWC